MTTPTPRIGIGALSRATGVPANTIRTWERRYGFPKAERTEGGHRLYDAAVVEHLVLIQRAIDQGHRPGQLMSMSLDVLREMLGELATASTSAGSTWLGAVEDLDAAALERHFSSGLARHGLTTFLEDLVNPFLVELGERWNDGTLSIYQEHFASARLKAFLADRWRTLAANNDGPTVILATLPGEDHSLGLHMAGCIFALAGWQLVLLGPNVPVNDILACVAQTSPRLVAISVSIYADTALVAKGLEKLAAEAPDGVSVLVGGRGAVSREDITTVPDLAELARWVAKY